MSFKIYYIYLFFLLKLASCLLRNVSNKNSRLHAIPAGLIASVSFAMFPNNTIALYVMWKSLQVFNTYQ